MTALLVVGNLWVDIVFEGGETLCFVGDDIHHVTAPEQRN